MNPFVHPTICHMVRTAMASQLTRIQRYITEFRPWFAHLNVDVLVCRRWTVTDSFHAHAGKGYIFSDSSGYVIQGEARCSIKNCSVCTLEEGRVYNIRNFKLLPNTSHYCFNRYAAICLQLDHTTLVTPVTCSLDGFVRHPFQLISIEDVTFNESKHLIDVIGVVSRVDGFGRTIAGTFMVDCQIFSAKGCGMRMTLMNAVAEKMIEEQQPNMPVNIFILTSMDVREFNGELYLSSTQATTVHNCEGFPAERAKFVRAIEVVLQGLTTDAGEMPPQEDYSLTHILYMGRAHSVNELQASVTIMCRVMIVGIKMLEAWIIPICPVDSCQARATYIGNGFWCESCQQLTDYAPPGYNLHLDVTDGIIIVTIAVPNTIAEKLMNKRAATLIAEQKDTLNRSTPPAILLGLYGTTHTIELNSHTYCRLHSHEMFSCSSIYTPLH